MAFVAEYSEAYQFFRDRTGKQVSVTVNGEKCCFLFWTSNRVIFFWAVERPGVTMIHWDAPESPIVIHDPKFTRPTQRIINENWAPSFPPPLQRLTPSPSP